MDLYRILHISRSASIEEIKTSYRKLAKLYHPDLFKVNKIKDKASAESHFKSISNAYQVLSKVETKAEYDRSIGNWHLNNDYDRSNTKESNNKTYNNNTRSNGTTAVNSEMFIRRDHYNVQAWYDHYYGNIKKDNKNEGVAGSAPFVSYPGETKHQQYYRRKHVREQQGNHKKWNVDEVYEKIKNNSTSNNNDNKSNKDDEPTYNNNTTTTKTNKTSSNVKNKEQGRPYEVYQEEIRTIAENLRSRRAERIQGAKTNMTSGSSCTLS